MTNTFVFDGYPDQVRATMSDEHAQYLYVPYAGRHEIGVPFSVTDDTAAAIRGIPYLTQVADQQGSSAGDTSPGTTPDKDGPASPDGGVEAATPPPGDPQPQAQAEPVATDDQASSVAREDQAQIT